MRDLRHDYVLVPADKAPNVIVVCRKYYMDVVKNELESTIPMYMIVECEQVVAEHLQFIVTSGIDKSIILLAP